MNIIDKLAAQQEPFTMVTLGGETVHIRLLSARQVAQWWTWVYEKADARKLYDEQLVELFKRCACDADGKPLIDSAEDAKKLREQPGAGRMLSEFWTECKRRNFLYETAAEEDRERDRFFTERKIGGITGSTASSDASPSVGAQAIRSPSPTT